jgi:threonine dehydrogenase-like Zn-dependent dehydrogenase
MKSLNVYLVAERKVELREEDVPEPAPDEVQVRCIANGICMGEVSLFSGWERSRMPCKLGHEGIGVVVKVGREVKGIAEGDYVICWSWDTYQNIKASHVRRFSIIPDDPACYLAEPVACVINALYAYDISPGDRVLLMGAGFMGLLNLQALGRYPLSELVVTDVKHINLELANEFGATSTIDVGTDDGRRELEELKKTPFDLVIDSAGAAEVIEMAGEFVRPGGRLAIFAWHHHPRTINMSIWHTRGLRVLNTAPMIGADRNVDNMMRAIKLLEKGYFDLHKLVTHRHHVTKVQEALELACERPEGYIKGVIVL